MIRYSSGRTCTLSTIILSLVLGSFFASVPTAWAASVSSSASAPTVDGEDIAQLTANYEPGGNEGHVWANRPIHGQSFTTGSSASGYLLNALTLKNTSTDGSAGSWTIYVGTISGSVLTPIRTESSGTVTIVPDDYITWTFDTPVELDPNTLYGFDVDVATNGFISAGNSDPNSYTGGHPFSNGGGGTPDHNNLTFHTSFERVFHADMEINGDVIWATPGVSNITTTAADAYATLEVTDETNAVAWLYWDTSDMGETNSAWAYTNSLGTVTTGLVESTVSNLSHGTTYFARFYGTNSTVTNASWSDPFSFTSVLVIANSDATDLGSTTATFNATLYTPGTNYDVTVYWGTNNGQTTAGAWGNTNFIGSYTNVSPTDLSFAAGGLTDSTQYYYAFRATNNTDDFWAQPSTSLTTVGSPTVENTGGATPHVGYATLNGELTGGVLAEIYVCWGTSPGGESTSDWQNVAYLGANSEGIAFSTNTVGALYGPTYYYRCFATNLLGGDWSPVISFTVLRELFGTNALNHFGYHINNDALAMDLNNDGGMMGGGDPATFQNFYGQAFLTSGPGDRGLNFDTDADFTGTGAIGQNDNYSSLFLGYFVPKQDGNLELRRSDQDDATGMWFDKDRDGVFESSTPGLGSDRDEQLAWGDGGTKTVPVLEGLRYKVAFTHREGGGGSRCEFQFRGPSMGGQVVIKPADAAQDGMWQYELETPLALTLENASVSNVTPGKAYLNGTLTAPGQVYDVYVYWGTTDYTNNKSAWIAGGSNAFVGSYTNVTDAALTYQATGLELTTNYYYAFYASNALEQIWAQPSASFESFGVPTVEAIGATDTDFDASATLNGSLTKGGFADIYICWGQQNEGTGDTSAWENVVSLSSQTSLEPFSTEAGGMLYGLPYYYTCFATNSAGGDWSAVTNFLIGKVILSTNGLNHYGYHASDNNHLNLHDNGGMMNGGDPAGFEGLYARVLLTDGPGNRGLDFNSDGDFINSGAVTLSDNYENLFLGYLHALEDGDYQFKRNSDDDTAGIWLDLDQDGVFESDPTGLGSDRGEQLQWDGDAGTKTKTLTAGYYRFAATHREGTGGSNVEIQFKAPPMGGLVAIQPTTDPNQDGMWFYDSALNVGVANSGISGLIPGQVDLGGILYATQSVYDVWVYWATNDHGTNATAWLADPSAGSQYMGSFTNVASNALSHTVTGLVPAVTYYYTYHATNLAEEAWDDTYMFGSFGPPTVENTGATETDFNGGARLSGNLAQGGAADIYVCWGAGNEGTGDTSAWENVELLAGETTFAPFSTNVSGLLYGIPYYFTCFATNSTGGDWSSVTNFLTGKKLVTAGGLHHYGYHASDNNHLNLHDNGGMMNGGDPTTFQDFQGHTLLTAGPGNRGLDFNSDGDFTATGVISQNDNYENLFLGYLRALEDGEYKFKRNADDDAVGIWLDLDQDHVFESDPTGLGSDRGEQLQWDNDANTKTKTLAKGYYRFAATHREGSGGASIDVQLKAPSMDGLVTIQPTTDPDQDGMWFYDTELNIGITNSGITGLLPGQADLNGILNAEQAVYDVWVYWATNDHGTNAAAWMVDASGDSQYMGSFTNVAETALAHTVTGLASSITYYYNYHASNQMEETWGDTFMFGSAGPPTVENTGGAIVDIGTAILQGELISGGLADIYVCWGTGLGGENTSAWQNVEYLGTNFSGIGFSTNITDAFYGITYYYRCFATNSQGGDWADSATNFTTLRPQAPVQVLPVTNNLEVWYDASTLTLSDSDPVTAWTDQSGNGRDLATWQGTPTFETNEINGLPAVRFDANENLLPTAGNPYLAKDVFVVFRSGNGTKFGPDWGAPIGYRGDADGDRTWMLQGNEDRFWDSEKPEAVTRNGVEVDDVNNFDMSYLSNDMGQYMVLKVVSSDARSGTQTREYSVGTRSDGWSNSRFDTAEVIAYSTSLSTNDENEVGGYLAWKYGIATGYDPFTPDNANTITNTPASNLAPEQAQLNAILDADGAVYDVTVYWSTNDYGTNATYWVANGSNASVGSFTNVVIELSHVVSNLTPATTYYYTFHGTNQSAEIWGEPSMIFNSMGAPTVDNDGGATDIGVGRATLRGELTAGGAADIYVCWGQTKGGTSTSAWEHVEPLGETIELLTFSTNISGAYYGIPYYYRCFATNFYGGDWADSATNFMTLRPESTVSYARIDIGPSGQRLEPGTWQGLAGAPANNNNGTELSGLAMTSDTGDTFVFSVDDTDTGGNDVGAIDWRDRGDSTSSETLVQVGEDFIKNNNGIVRITLSSIPAGEYDVISYHVDPDNAQSGQIDVKVSTDGVSYSGVLDSGDANLAYGGVNNLTTVNIEASQAEFSFTANGSNDVRIVFDGRPHADDEVPLGGFEITTIGVDLTITNTPPTDRGITNVTLNATISISDSVYDVWAYWGPTNGMTNVAAWTNEAYVGTYTNVVGTEISHTIGGLTQSSTPYYTFRLSNAVETVWAQPSEQVLPISAPEVINVAPVVGIGSATLNGELTTGNVADVYIYWGTSDGETNKLDWDGFELLSDALQGTFSRTVAAGYGMTYYYRCYATNAVSHDWADSSTNFTTINPGGEAGSITLIDEEFTGGAQPVNTAHVTWSDSTGGGFETYNSGGAGARTMPDNYDHDLDGDTPNVTIPGGIEVNDNAGAVTLTATVTMPDEFAPGSGVLTFFAGTRTATGPAPTITIVNTTDGTTVLATETVTINATVNTWEYNLDSGLFSTADIGDTIEVRWHGGPSSNGQGLQLCDIELTVSLGIPPAITNEAVSDVSEDAVTMNGTLTTDGWVFDVWAYWGETNGTNNPNAWTNMAHVGWFTNHDGAVSYPITGLTGQTGYYYTFQATNQVTNLWADPSMLFETLGPITVTNLAEGTITATSAVLRAQLLAGGTGDATIYWGTSDPGSTNMGWDASTNIPGVVMDPFEITVPVLAGGTYYYRAYATNAIDDDWADTAESFTVPGAAVSLSADGSFMDETGGVVTVTATLDVPAFSNVTVNFAFGGVPEGGALTHKGYHKTGWVNEDLDLHNNGGLLSMTPYNTVTLTSGPGDRGLDFNNDGDFINSGAVNQNDNYLNLFTGYFNPPTTGSYEFRVNGDDDRSGMWIDLDRDGIFESNPTGLGQNRGEQLAWEDGNTHTVTLTNGFSYLFACTHAEGTAGASIEAQFKTPSMADQVTIKPSDPAQAGMWSISTNVASYPSDYTSTATSVVIPAGSLFANITIIPVDDIDQEEDEGWEVSIGSVINATGGVPDSVNGTINSGDPKVTAEGGFTDVVAPDATLNGVLTMGDGAEVTMFWGTTDGGTTQSNWSATSVVGIVNEDVAFSTNITGLAGGETYYYRCYATNGSNLAEDWSDVVSTSLPPASVSIDNISVIEGNTGTTTAVFTVSLSSPNLTDVSVDYATSNNTAIAGDDYTATNGTVTIPAGQTSTQVMVLVLGDTIFEHPPETFYVNLSDPVNGTLGESQGVCTIREDDETDDHLAGWLYRMRVNFDGYGGNEALTNWPALVRLGETIPDFEYDTFASTNGYDLRFTDTDGTTLLNFEIEEWDTGGESAVWVQLPELPTVGTYIWAYWNNPGETTLPVYATNGSTWESNYRGVWHLHGTNDSGNFPDSTTNGNTGVNSGSVNTNNPVIGDAQLFTDDYIDCGTDPSLDLTEAFTVSAWTYFENSQNCGLVYAGGGWGQQGYGLHVQGNNLRTEVRGASGVTSFDRALPPLQQWTLVTLRWDPDDDSLILYYDGVQQGAAGTRDNVNAIGYNFNIGRSPGGSIDGMIDEVRAEETARSLDWITASYSNQVPGSTFVTYGEVSHGTLGTIILVR